MNYSSGQTYPRALPGYGYPTGNSQKPQQAPALPTGYPYSYSQNVTTSSATSSAQYSYLPGVAPSQTQQPNRPAVSPYGYNPTPSLPKPSAQLQIPDQTPYGYISTASAVSNAPVRSSTTTYGLGLPTEKPSLPAANQGLIATFGSSSNAPENRKKHEEELLKIINSKMVNNSVSDDEIQSIVRDIRLLTILEGVIISGNARTQAEKEESEQQEKALLENIERAAAIYFNDDVSYQKIEELMQSYQLADSNKRGMAAVRSYFNKKTQYDENAVRMVSYAIAEQFTQLTQVLNANAALYAVKDVYGLVNKLKSAIDKAIVFGIIPREWFFVSKVTEMEQLLHGSMANNPDAPMEQDFFTSYYGGVVFAHTNFKENRFT